MSIDDILYEKFGYRSFRNGQREIIEDVLDGKDVFAMLPTGSGKSICYQLPAYLLDGTVIVVSPLISLMEDQVEQLRRNGEKRVCTFHSGMPYDLRKTVLRNLSRYKIIYVSPETLQSDLFANALSKKKVSLFVVDEAHCISQWGHEFRTDYLKLGDAAKKMGRPPILALTATATMNVREDIIKLLTLDEPEMHIYSVDRPNIALQAEIVDSTIEKMDILIRYAQMLKGPGLIYTSSRNAAETITETLKRNGVGRTAYYHGGMDNDDRLLIQKQFIYNELDVICCTNAFGMGINKSDIRFVIHFHFPSNIESYLQEIGRAGRDGEQSLALILYHEDDDFIPARLITSELPSERDIDDLINYVNKDEPIRGSFQEGIRLLDLTETAERFIQYHVELFFREDYKDLLDWRNKLVAFIEMRLKEKQERIRYMKKWIQSRDCKRESILKSFSEELTERPLNCCHICGVSIEHFKATISKTAQSGKYSWEEELALIFHQENIHV
ncbi:ATP-dependent DNA helicase RecQ [Bacillus sp. Marseille-Q3570]|uniref:RecQ family ATP-dependent DNA helicase n=1 Tax=Bacillus sp. Marseille-Q3570 TaxID=2963522 RepID=UPI0021B723F8|nr:ATP-dependent DNA helicase RecQ [Bacillus sp. Marseille-Q3570]